VLSESGRPRPPSVEPLWSGRNEATVEGGGGRQRWSDHLGRARRARPRSTRVVRERRAWSNRRHRRRCRIVEPGRNVVTRTAASINERACSPPDPSPEAMETPGLIRGAMSNHCVPRIRARVPRRHDWSSPTNTPSTPRDNQRRRTASGSRHHGAFAGAARLAGIADPVSRPARAT
jgi:hypothetical protein